MQKPCHGPSLPHLANLRGASSLSLFPAPWASLLCSCECPCSPASLLCTQSPPPAPTCLFLLCAKCTCCPNHPYPLDSLFEPGHHCHTHKDLSHPLCLLNHGVSQPVEPAGQRRCPQCADCGAWLSSLSPPLIPLISVDALRTPPGLLDNKQAPGRLARGLQAWLPSQGWFHGHNKCPAQASSLSLDTSCSSLLP